MACALKISTLPAECTPQTFLLIPITPNAAAFVFIYTTYRTRPVYLSTLMSMLIDTMPTFHSLYWTHSNPGCSKGIFITDKSTTISNAFTDLELIGVIKTKLGQIKICNDRSDRRPHR